MPLPLSPATVPPQTSPAAGVAFTIDYYPMRGGVSFDPESNGGTVDRLDIYSTEARTGSPLVTVVGAVKVTAGQYRFSVPSPGLPEGIYYTIETWTPTSSATVVTDPNDFFVVPAFSGTFGVGPVSLAQIKLAMRKNLSTTDVELQAMIDQAVAEYERWVGPVSGSFTRYLDGGRERIVLPHPVVDAVTAVSYTDGSVVDVTGLRLDTDTGIVYWRDPNGYFQRGTKNVIVTYTVGDVPADHVGVIIADVCGYFEATQRGPAALPGEGFAAAQILTPQILFPRIRALVKGAIG